MLPLVDRDLPQAIFLDRTAGIRIREIGIQPVTFDRAGSKCYKSSLCRSFARTAGTLLRCRTRVRCGMRKLSIPFFLSGSGA